MLALCVERGACLCGVVAVTDHLRIRIACPHGADERQEGFLLHFGPGVARFVVVVNPADITDRHRTVVHIALRAMLSVVLIGA